MREYFANPLNCVAMIAADIVAFVGMFMTGHIYAFFGFFLIGLPAILALHIMSQGGSS